MIEFICARLQRFRRFWNHLDRGTILTVQARQAHKEAASLCLDQLCPSSAEPFLLRAQSGARCDITLISGLLAAGPVLFCSVNRLEQQNGPFKAIPFGCTDNFNHALPASAPTPQALASKM